MQPTPVQNDVAGAERELVVVGGRDNLALEHVVALLERVVVGQRRAAGLVLDHEHRVQDGAQSLIDQHLHGDAAVGQQRRRHACRDRGRVDGRADLEVVDVHLPRAEPEQRARARIADVRLAAAGLRQRFPCPEGVRRPDGPRHGRVGLEQQGGGTRLVAVAVGDSDRQQPALM